MPFRIFFRLSPRIRGGSRRIRGRDVAVVAPRYALRGYHVANSLPSTVHASRNRCEKSFLKWILRHKRSKNESLVIPKMDI